MQTTAAVISPFTPAKRFLSRPETVRFLGLARNVQLDEKGNAREADIYRLDLTDGRFDWVSWRPGDFRQCLHPFRFELFATARAGLHIRMGLTHEDDALDHRGYRIEQADFCSTFKIRQDGVFVLTPGFSFSPGYHIQNVRNDAMELEVLINNIEFRYFQSVSVARQIVMRSIADDGQRRANAVA